jgi:hypothetical protein
LARAYKVPTATKLSLPKSMKLTVETHQLITVNKSVNSLSLFMYYFYHKIFNDEVSIKLKITSNLMIVLSFIFTISIFVGRQKFVEYRWELYPCPLFIKAEVIRIADYKQFKTEAGCRENGKISIEGKEYVVQDGDIMHFRFNV